MVAPSPRRQTAGDDNTHSFEVHRKDGPSLGRLTLPYIKALIDAGRLGREDYIVDDRGFDVPLGRWPSLKDNSPQTGHRETPDSRPAAGPPVAPVTERLQASQVLGEHIIDQDGPMPDDSGVTLQALLEQAQARVEEPGPAAKPARNEAAVAEWADYDPFEPPAVVDPPSPQPPPSAPSATLESPSRTAPPRPSSNRAAKPKKLSGRAHEPRRVLAIFTVLILATYATALLPADEVLGPTIPNLLLVQLMVISAAGVALLVSITRPAKPEDFASLPATHLAATLGVGALLGATLPSLGLQESRASALLVRLGLAVSLELVLRASFDTWLANRLQSRMRTTLISGALFCCLYVGVLLPWVGGSLQLWGSALLFGVFLAWGGVATKSPRLVTLCHFLAATSSAIIVG